MVDQSEITQPQRTPSAQDAATILRQALGQEIRTISRFQTGLAHYVYDVVTQEEERLVIRLTRPGAALDFAGALHWFDQLAAIGVPLPKLYFSSLDVAHYGFPVMIMERLPGVDLNYAYPTLTSPQKRAIAEEIVKVQRSVATLPLGRGYGYAASQDDPSLLPRWIDVLDQNIERSRRRIQQAGLVDSTIADRIKALIRHHEGYFTNVQPTCFLDDTTTKNVIIGNGALSGIVDVDTVAYGDPLLTPGLTRMSLLASGYDTLYTDYWTELLSLDSAQQRALNLYTALFAVDFLGEKGHAFNKEQPVAFDQKQIDHLINVFNTITTKL